MLGLHAPVKWIGLVSCDVFSPGDDSRVFFCGISEPRIFSGHSKLAFLSSRFVSGSQQIENSTSDKHFRQELKGVKIGVKKVRNSGIRVGHVVVISKPNLEPAFCELYRSTTLDQVQSDRDRTTQYGTNRFWSIDPWLTSYGREVHTYNFFIIKNLSFL